MGQPNSCLKNKKKMNSFRIIAVSLFCTMLFSSCQKNYERLIEGSWQGIEERSYYVANGKRHYLGDEGDEAASFRIQFENGFYNLLWGYSHGKETADKGKYHIDKDMVFIKGDPARISKMNNTTMVLENSEVHIEFDRIDYNPFLMFLKNIQCSPLWIRIVVCIVLLVLSFVLYILGGKVKDDNSWWDMKNILRIISVVMCFFTLIILFG